MPHTLPGSPSGASMQLRWMLALQLGKTKNTAHHSTTDLPNTFKNNNINRKSSLYHVHSPEMCRHVCSDLGC
jgi:hypothetical protein